MFKKTLLAAVCGLLLFGLGGCAQKPQALIRLDSYVPNAAILQKSGIVVIESVTDARKDKRRVGSITKGSKTVTVVYNDQPLDEWLADALKKSLEAEGCKVVSDMKGADKRVARIKVEIDSLKATLDKSVLTGENLTAEARATLFIEQGGSKITKHLSLIQSKWAPPFAGEDEIREYLQDTLAGLVEEIRENIDMYRF